MIPGEMPILFEYTDCFCSWLIEVNASPSLTASSQSDYELKCRLLEDMLHIIDMENRLI